MKNKSLFISDIHLGLEDEKKEAIKESVICQILNSNRDSIKNLFILGDLFDYWFEYRKVYQKGYYRIFTALKDLQENGVQIYYLIGNHDFMHRDFFKREFGAELIQNDLEVVLNGKKFFLSHGDSLVYKDYGYKILKVILRNRVLQFLYSLIHPDFGIWIASSSSKGSRKYTTARDYGKEDGLLVAAKKKIDAGYDYVIMGHTHKKTYLPHKQGIYINLGSWLEEPCYGIFDGDNFEIKDWKI